MNQIVASFEKSFLQAYKHQDINSIKSLCTDLIEFINKTPERRFDQLGAYATSLGISCAKEKRPSSKNVGVALTNLLQALKHSEHVHNIHEAANKLSESIYRQDYKQVESLLSTIKKLVKDLPKEYSSEKAQVLKYIEISLVPFDSVYKAHNQNTLSKQMQEEVSKLIKDNSSVNKALKQVSEHAKAICLR